jgi:polysaccharide biosynthesis transport protein
MSTTAPTPPLTLSDIWTIMRRRRRIAIIAAVIAAALALIVPRYLAPPLYRAEATLTARDSAGPVDFQDDPAAATRSEQALNTQRELLTSKGVLQNALALGGLTLNPSYARSADPLALLQQRLATSVIRNSWVITVSLKDEDPRLAEDGLQAVLDAFISHQNSSSRKHAADDLAFLAAQVQESEQKLDAAREAERVFRTEHLISSVDPDRNHLTERIQRLAAKQAELDDRIAANESLIKQTHAASEIADPKLRQSALLRLDNISKFTVVGSLQTELFQLEGQEAELSSQYLDKHPKLIEVRSHLAAKRQQLADIIAAACSGIESEHLALLEQRKALDQTMLDLHKTLGAYREDLVTLQRLGTETLRLQKFHEELVAKQAQTAVRSAYAERHLAVDSPPRSSPLPGSVSRVALLLLALVAALAASATSAFLVDALDQRIADPAAVQRSSGLPCLGSVHLTRTDTPAGLGGDSLLAEDLRSILAALRFRLPPGETGRCVLVLSAEPGAGRTALAGWLAEGLAVAGSHALLVDGDLRQPDLTARWSLNAQPGLAEILAGQPGIAPITSTIQNLLVTPAGTCAAHPGELLNSPCLGEWLTHCRSHYDAIILDAPPLETCSDGVIMGQQVDAVVLVIRAGVSTAAGLRTSLQGLEPLRSKIVGFILNGVEPPPERNGPAAT